MRLSRASICGSFVPARDHGSRYAMDNLQHRALGTLSLDVDLSAVIGIGAVPGGTRMIAPVAGGRLEGERISAIVRPGHDWLLARADGSMAIDVRLTLDSDDGATIYLAYQGTMGGPGLAQLSSGQPMAPGSYKFTMVAQFECGEPRYAWLNHALIVGVGEQAAAGPVYRLYEIG